MPAEPVQMRPSRRDGRHVKSINLALQGGGAHGAFTWGVLDRLFEDDRIWIEAISGASAGALNAMVAAQGMVEGGADGARARLAAFWRAVSRAGAASPLRRSPFAVARGDWGYDGSASFLWFDLIGRVASPYQLNPFGIDPLRALIAEHVDFAKVRACGDMGVFVATTNVETGRGRVFAREEIDLDVALASVALPTIRKAVEIDGQPYWDGGFMGNPPLFPFFAESAADDILVVQINPVHREGAPKTARAIQNRVNEITFNSALLHELRAIDFVTRLLDAGKLDPADYRRMRVHIVTARKRMRALDASSKLNVEWPFLLSLFETGRETADCWLDDHFDDLGVRSSVDIRAIFQGPGALPHDARPATARKSA